MISGDTSLGGRQYLSFAMSERSGAGRSRRLLLTLHYLQGRTDDEIGFGCELDVFHCQAGSDFFEQQPFRRDPHVGHLGHDRVDDLHAG